MFVFYFGCLVIVDEATGKSSPLINISSLEWSQISEQIL